MPIPQPPADPFASFADQKGIKKILIVIPYWEGDRDIAQDLCRLLADLEPGRNTLADILLYKRNDAQWIDESVQAQLKSKFLRVWSHKCRRINVTGYPQGPNEMWYDLVEFFRKPEWNQNYYCWVNLEPDCVPTDRRWISKIALAYRESVDEGKPVMGHICEVGATSGIAITHVNGAAVYPLNLFDLAGGLAIIGGPHDWAYDFYHAEKIMPLAKDTPLIYLDYNRKTITSEDLWAIKKSGIAPVIIHGVKDGSAMQIVRAKLIDKKGDVDLSDRTIHTYYDPVEDVAEGSQRECIEVWKKAWLNAGWNPVISNRFDAAKHPRAAEFSAKADALGVVKHKGYNRARFLRYLALAYQGGGVFAEYDVLPMPTFAPEELHREPGFTILQKNKDRLTPSLFVADRTSIEHFIDYVLAYKITPEAPVLTDTDLLNMIAGDKREKWLKHKNLVEPITNISATTASVVHFSSSACKAYSPGTPRSRVMERWYRQRFEQT